MTARTRKTEPEADPAIGPFVEVCIAPGEWRWAVVTRVWSPDCVNVQVFLDGAADAEHGALSSEVRRHGSIAWCTSLTRGEEVGQWR